MTGGERTRVVDSGQDVILMAQLLERLATYDDYAAMWDDGTRYELLSSRAFRGIDVVPGKLFEPPRFE